MQLVVFWKYVQQRGTVNQSIAWKIKKFNCTTSVHLVVASHYFIFHGIDIRVPLGQQIKGAYKYGTFNCVFKQNSSNETKNSAVGNISSNCMINNIIELDYVKNLEKYQKSFVIYKFNYATFLSFKLSLLFFCKISSIDQKFFII